MHDLVIRRGTVVAGTGGAPIVADVLVQEGVIAAVERDIVAPGAESLDAEGLLVTPGFVDVHTHYDGQVTWENSLRPSSGHGVTTVVMGNCGVGFAPCRSRSRDDLIRLMEGIEDIPEVVMTTGIPWEWETFPDYLNFLDQRCYDADIATQLPHAALRVFVMGERGMNREVATDDDMTQMRDLAAQAVEAGALGFSTSQSVNHKTKSGQPTPSFEAAEHELHMIASGLAKANRGVLQVISDFPTVDVVPQRVRFLVELSRRSGRPLSFTLAQFHSAPHSWARVLPLIEAARTDGVAITGQVFPRTMGMVMSLDTTRNPFSASQTYGEIAGLPLEQRVATMRRPDVRERILDEARRAAVQEKQRRFDMVFPLRDAADYEPAPDQSVAALATAHGVAPDELAFDLMLADGGRGLLNAAFANIIDGNLDSSLAMMTSDATIIGLGDGGAHYGLICDSGYPSFMLSYWGRDRTRGPRLPLPYIVKSLAYDTAAAVGLRDRGLLKPGYKADLNLIDFDRLRLDMPVISRDLPSGGKRLTQSVSGIRSTIVSGVETQHDGEPTGLVPGRLVRGAHTAAQPT